MSKTLDTDSEIKEYQKSIYLKLLLAFLLISTIVGVLIFYIQINSDDFLNLKGKTETQVIKKLGHPSGRYISRFYDNSLNEIKMMGPQPENLSHGDIYVAMQYQIQNEMYYVILVDKKLYQSLNRKVSGPNDLYVIDVFRYPVDAIW